MNIGERKTVTGIPFAPSLGMLAGYVACVLECHAEACGTNHSAIAARKAPVCHPIPVWAVKVRLKQAGGAVLSQTARYGAFGALGNLSGVEHHVARCDFYR